MYERQVTLELVVLGPVDCEVLSTAYVLPGRAPGLALVASINVPPPFQQEAQMRGILTMQAAKRPSAVLSARNRGSERNQRKKIARRGRRWTKSKDDYPLLRATRTGRQDSAATPHEATHS